LSFGEDLVSLLFQAEAPDVRATPFVHRLKPKHWTVCLRSCLLPSEASLLWLASADPEPWDAPQRFAPSELEG
jgi:hypothetical protein